MSDMAARSEQSYSEREDAVLAAFRKAARDALMYGFDAELLAEEIAAIPAEEVDDWGDDDD